ncbi:MAG: glycosyltransferase domain-containing protein [Pseudomonadota bacterium]
MAASRPLVTDAVRAEVKAMRKVVYTCTFADYDTLLSPIRRTEGAEFLHFSDKPASFATAWQHRTLPEAVSARPQNEANRYCKLFPHRVLPQTDVSIYVDGNILLLDDLTPLIEAFVASGADIALFPPNHPRSVAQEIELVLKGDRLTPERAEAARKELSVYRREGHSDLPVTMNGILFRRHGRPRLEALMQAWWDEITRWAMRDQFSLPRLLAASDVTVHAWDFPYGWGDPYFLRLPHLPKTYARKFGWVSDTVVAARMLSPYKPLCRLVHYPEAAIRRLTSGALDLAPRIDQQE